MRTNQKLVRYLGALYNVTYETLHYFSGDDLVIRYPDWDVPLRKMLEYKASIEHAGLTFHYFTTEDGLMIGIVRNEKSGDAVLVGPVSTVPVTRDTVQSLIVKYALNQEDPNDILDFFSRTSTFNLFRFLNVCSLVNRELNGTVIDILEKYKLENTEIQNKVAKEHSATLVDRKENQVYHDTYFFEQQYLTLLEKGDSEGIRHLFAHVPPITEGKVAFNSVRQAKNIFISNIALATRHAIAGGMDIETAYQLSDSYIQEIEKMNDVSAITLMNGTALLDFAKRVSDAKIPQGMSQEIFYCLQYISNHVNQEISVSLLAADLHMERSTLSKRFKRELGFNISAYITRRKLEEAKSLLHFTDKTVSEISAYLCFSTQSYFQNVFKKKYGLSPKEYRTSVKSN